MNIKNMDEEARKKTLEELMEAMGALDGKRLPKPVPPAGEPPKKDNAEPPYIPDGVKPPANDGAFSGMDQRLAEIIKKKKEEMA